MKSYRVQKLISNYGYCSRRKAESLIKKGLVKVNGKQIHIYEFFLFLKHQKPNFPIYIPSLEEEPMRQEGG